MTQLQISSLSVYRNLCLDEENRLMAVKDEDYLSVYMYNAGGERVWKFSGDVERMTINAKEFIDHAHLYNKTLYTSPYLVMTDKSYTKHIFAESQRICSKIGGGFKNSQINLLKSKLDLIEKNHDILSKQLSSMLNRGFDCTEIKSNHVSIEPFLKFTEEAVEMDEEEKDLYFYHTDHLGSAAWITYSNGEVYQHLQYLPYGEQFVAQKISDWSTRYKFTGHERDMETGFDYAHARYYNSDFSIFMSVDPLSDARPGLSPYNYCQLNPVMRIDPTGMLDDNIEDPNGQQGNAGTGYKATSDGKYLYGNGLKTLVWNPDKTSGGNLSANGNGGYDDYTGPEIDFDNYEKNQQVKVYIETDGLGHAYIQIGNVVYDYGEWNGGFSKDRFSVIGDGILIKKKGSEAEQYINDRMMSSPTEVYTIEGLDARKMVEYFEGMTRESQTVSLQNGLNKYANKGNSVDTYVFLGNHCGTKVTRALGAGGMPCISPRSTMTPVYVGKYLNLYRKGYVDKGFANGISVK